MPKFIFRLRSVHMLRRFAEDESADALAQKRLRLQELTEYGQKLTQKHRYWSQAYLRMSREGMSPAQAVRMADYLAELGRLIEENSRMIREQERTVENARLELIEKMKERKTLDKLYEKQKAAFTARELSRHEKEIDDLVMCRI